MDHPLKMETTTVTQVEKTLEFKLSDKNILDLLRNNSITFPENAEIEVFVPVPGGGDWSNMDLDIDKETPVVVRVKIRERTVT